MAQPSNPGRPAQSWSAAVIVAREQCCAAAKALKDRRFLAAECPRLPLAECSHPASCTCTYKKYQDRRAGPRREDEDTGIRRYVEPTKERRAGRGRRQDDQQ